MHVIADSADLYRLVARCAGLGLLGRAGVEAALMG